ncbi:MAG: response regulator [Dongiaceae bacterium]
MARILVIDDDELVRQTVKMMLEAGGHEVALAAHGGDGLKKFRLRPYDLVVCDILMPEKEGVETVKELRQLTRTTPIIAMTGGPPIQVGANRGGDVDYLHMAKALGATQTLRKPFIAAQLRALVRDVSTTVRRRQPEVARLLHSSPLRTIPVAEHLRSEHALRA